MDLLIHLTRFAYVRQELEAKKPLGAETFCAHKLEKQMHLHRKACTKYFELQSLHKALPSTTMYYKTCTQYSPVLLCKQSLHRVLPSTTLCYKACTKHLPVLLCTTKLAQSTSQYYFVLQSLHKVLPSTTLYYKAYTKLFAVLLCTTKLAQYYKACTQYYFVLQSLHKSTSMYHFVLQSLHNKSFYTQQVLSQRKLLHTTSFDTQQAFTHRTLIHRMLLHMASVYILRSFYN